MSMFNLRLSIRKGKFYCLFLDFKLLFDTIKRKVVWFKLFCMRVSIKFLGILKNLYSSTEGKRFRQINSDGSSGSSIETEIII